MTSPLPESLSTQVLSVARRVQCRQSLPTARPHCPPNAASGGALASLAHPSHPVSEPTDLRLFPNTSVGTGRQPSSGPSAWGTWRGPAPSRLWPILPVRAHVPLPGRAHCCPRRSPVHGRPWPWPASGQLCSTPDSGSHASQPSRLHLWPSSLPPATLSCCPGPFLCWLGRLARALTVASSLGVGKP